MITILSLKKKTGEISYLCKTSSNKEEKKEHEVTIDPSRTGRYIYIDDKKYENRCVCLQHLKVISL